MIITVPFRGVLRKSIFAASILICSFYVKSQTFTNGGLEGPVGSQLIPPGWSAIPYTDVNCIASDLARATCDTEDASTAVPNSGTTCVHAGMGVAVFPAGLMFHEGIQQTVSGFTIGNSYTIEFYQTLKPSFATQDNTGSWSVYLDNTFIATAALTTATTALGDVNVIWDYRTVTFTATSTTHVVKFLPYDEDAYSPAMTATISIYIDDIKFQSPMPIELIEFQGYSLNNQNNLTWKTKSETNNSHFIIERSVNQSDFMEIGRVEGNGNSNQVLEYSFADQAPYSGHNYYRIKQIDFNGEFSYTNVVHIYLDEDQSNIQIVPNPNNGNFSLLTNTSSEKGNITIYNLNGSIAMETPYVNNAGHMYNISALAPGIYVLMLESESNVSYEKFVITNSN